MKLLSPIRIKATQFQVTHLNNSREFECPEVLALVNVCDSSHERTQDDLGVVLKEIYLRVERVGYNCS